MTRVASCVATDEWFIPRQVQASADGSVPGSDYHLPGKRNPPTAKKSLAFRAIVS
jgi:hypothetical protein